MSNILLKRLVKHARQDDGFVQLFEDQSDDEILADFNSNEELFMVVLEDYKSRWDSLRQGAVGFFPCTSLKEVERVSRKADEKLLVMCGWHDPDGGMVGACAFCGIPLTPHEVTVDHLDPKCSGGSEKLANLVPACPDCNRLKSGKPADEFLTSEGLSPGQIAEWRQDLLLRLQFREQGGSLWMNRLSNAQVSRLQI
jgi:5-methylcytosine-specific restriction endonuclease McrA